MTEKKYDDTNRGALFKAEKKNEKDRDYSGQINVGGHDYWLSAWVNKDKNGRSYMSLSVKPKDGKPEQKQEPKQQRRSSEEEMDDFIPF